MDSIQSTRPEQPIEADERRLTRRGWLAAAAAALGAVAVQGVTRTASASDPNDVVKGAFNVANAPTVVQNTQATAGARALIGQSAAGAGSSSAGVWGDGKGTNGYGVVGTSHSGSLAHGVFGYSTSGIGVRAIGGPTGVLGSGTNYGVRGFSDNNYGVYGDGGYTGVYGAGPYGTYGSGTSAGAIGTSGAGYGFYGLGSIGGVGIGNDNGYGLWGYNGDSGGYGVVGQGGYRGLYASGGNAGVYGTSGYVGVWANASTTSGLNFGVYAYTGSSGGYAGVFSGAVQVSGFLSKLGGGFKIDHPLEPERRYLVHSFVESPEMLNVYSGTVRLDARGRATVRLPRYFDTANAEHRYQLTAIGAAAPGLHVAREVEGNRFAIAGGAPGQKVCWQVTGVRQDAWAKANPIRVEPLKRRQDQGSYLAPKAYGKPASAGILVLKPPSAAPRPKQRPRALRQRDRS